MAQTDKQSVTLTFYRTELLNDLRQLGYVEGDTKKVESEHDRHQVMDICEIGNIDRVVRVLGRSFAECVEFCYPFSRVSVSEEPQRHETDDELRNHDYYNLHLSLPADYSQTTVTLIKEYIHEYMISSVMADWMSITKPDASANWQAKADAAADGIKSSLHYRCGKVRRPLTPW